MDIPVGIGFTLTMLPGLIEEGRWRRLLQAARRVLRGKEEVWQRDYGIEVFSEDRAAPARPGLEGAQARLEEMLDTVSCELATYATFEEGWDGYRGRRFSPRFLQSVVAATLQVFQFLRDAGSVPTEVVPGPASDASVDIEFRAEPNVLILTFDPDEPQSVLVIREQDGTTLSEERVAPNRSGLEPALAWFAGTRDPVAPNRGPIALRVDGLPTSFSPVEVRNLVVAEVRVPALLGAWPVDTGTCPWSRSTGAWVVPWNCAREWSANSWRSAGWACPQEPLSG